MPYAVVTAFEGEVRAVVELKAAMHNNSHLLQDMHVSPAA
jgi:hypothetical protein